jgi:hypothetical protein
MKYALDSILALEEAFPSRNDPAALPENISGQGASGSWGCYSFFWMRSLTVSGNLGQTAERNDPLALVNNPDASAEETVSREMPCAISSSPRRREPQR